MSMQGLTRACRLSVYLTIGSWLACAAVWVISPGDGYSWGALLKIVLLWEGLIFTGMTIAQRMTLQRAMMKQREYEALVKWTVARGIASIHGG